MLFHATKKEQSCQKITISRQSSPAIFCMRRECYFLRRAQHYPAQRPKSFGPTGRLKRGIRKLFIKTGGRARPPVSHFIPTKFSEGCRTHFQTSLSGSQSTLNFLKKLPELLRNVLRTISKTS